MKLTKRGYAKINLALDVVGRKENGYHLVKMIMQTVDLYDVLTFEIVEDEAAEAIVITTKEAQLPTDENNLIYKAARILMDHCQVNGKVKIHLEKNIPIAAGMAGGSTDAAATLVGLNELFDLKQSEEELRELGVKIGADVPYCIMGGTALAEGIGEILTPLPAPKPCTLLIAKPEFGVSTKYVYEHIDREGIDQHPDVDGMIQALKDGSLSGVMERLGNVLQNVTEKEHPDIARLKEVMIENGAKAALMSGSGPTVFGMFMDEASARAAQEKVLEENLANQVFVTGFWNA